MKHIISVCTNSYHGFTVDQALEGIAAAGFKHVELTAVRNWTEHIMPDMPDGELNRIQAKMKDLGLSCLSLSGHCNLTDAARLSDFRANMELARRFGASYIISSTGEAHFGKDEAFTDDVLIENIKKLVPDLERLNLKLAIEVHGEYGTGEDVARIVKGVGSPLVGVNFDTANVVFYGGRAPEDDLKNCLEHVNYVHLKDKVGMNNTWNFPAVGKGDLKLLEVIQSLKDHGKQVPLSIEIEFTEDFTMRDKVPGDLEKANQAVKDSFDYLHKNGLI